MIVMRWTFQIKPTKFDEALDLARDGKKNVWSNMNGKIYFSNIGPLNTIILENEFKDMAEREKLSAEVVAKEEWGQWLAKWNEVTTGEGNNEVWNVE